MIGGGYFLFSFCLYVRVDEREEGEEGGAQECRPTVGLRARGITGGGESLRMEAKAAANDIQEAFCWVDINELCLAGKGFK